MRLVVVLALPALLFAGLWRWSASAATPPAPDAVSADSLNDDQSSGASTTSAQLSTSLMSMRRSPTLIVDDLVSKRVEAQTEPLRESLASLVGDDSCVVIVDGQGNPVFEHRPAASLVPASNEKLFVAAAALERLGNDAALVTEVQGAIPIGGTVEGSLFLVGGGDPLLSTDEFAIENGLAGFNVATLDGLVMQLVARGVTRVSGDVVGVDVRYDDERRAPDWNAAITGYDIPPLGSLVVDDGLDGAGSVPFDPALTAARLFRRKLVAAGIDVGGDALASTDPSPLAGVPDAVLAAASSPPMSALVTEMLQLSDNLTAELLLKEIGLAVAGEGSRSAGIQVINDLLATWGVPVDGVVLTDGSGLSRANRVTCRAMVDLLEVESVTDQVIDRLPVAGESGTLAEALLGSPAEGEMHAKTGSLNGVKALSGVQSDASGADVYFSVILNGPDRQLPSNYDPVWRAVADLIAQHNTPVSIDRAAFGPAPANSAGGSTP